MAVPADRTLGIVRVSTIEQSQEDRYSIPHQRAHIAEECANRRLELVHVFEFVQSGAKVMSEDGERRRVMQFIRENGVSVVMVHELDRLARSMLDTLLVVDELNRLGVTLISIHDGFDTSTPQGQLQMHILAAFAEYFRKQLASKVLGGMIERARKGLPMHGNRPIGYRLVAGPNAKLAAYEVDEEEAKTVRLMYDLYLGRNGHAPLGYRAISEHLNRAGLFTRRGKPWQSSKVRDTLANEVYTGTFVWRDVRIPNALPPIIDQSTYDQVRAQALRRADVGGRAAAGEFLLSGLLRCGRCGGSMVGVTTHKKYKDKPLTYRYYKCNNYGTRGSSYCSSRYYRCEDIESEIFKDIAAVIRSSKSTVKREFLPLDRARLEEDLQLRRQELEKTAGMIDRAAVAYEAGQYDLDFFSRRRDALKAEQGTLQQEIRRLEGALRTRPNPEAALRQVAERLADAEQLLRQADPKRVKPILLAVIDRITVEDAAKIQITYRV